MDFREPSGDDSLLTSALFGRNLSNPAASVRRRTFRSRFLPEHVYESYQRQQALCLQSLPPAHMRYRDLPIEFIDAFPLDKAMQEEDLRGLDAQAHLTTGTFGYVSTIFKCISTQDGMCYALRRVDGVRSQASIMNAVLQAWNRASHPTIVPLRRIFAGGAGGARGGAGMANAIFFAHDYYPGAQTMRERYLDQQALVAAAQAIHLQKQEFLKASGSRGPRAQSAAATAAAAAAAASIPQLSLIPEETMWSYVCQIVTGLKRAHEAGLSFRGIRAVHVLVTSHGRVRLAGAGVLDVLEADHAHKIEDLQRADIVGFGQLLLQLACRNPAAIRTQNLSLESVQKNYSTAFFGLIVMLLSQPVTIQRLCSVLAPQLAAELDATLEYSDCMDQLLAREADNGRLLRLLIKLGFINERPEHEGDPSWAETGERYQLKLLRDFIFHQVTDDGRPVLDVAHVIDSLNNLDVGTQNQVLLCSRDGASILVSRYDSLRTSLHGAFEELRLSARSKEEAEAASQPTTVTSSSTGVWRNLVPLPVQKARSGAALRSKNGRGNLRDFSANSGAANVIDPLALGAMMQTAFSGAVLGGVGAGEGSASMEQLMMQMGFGGNTSNVNNTNGGGGGDNMVVGGEGGGGGGRDWNDNGNGTESEGGSSWNNVASVPEFTPMAPPMQPPLPLEPPPRHDWNAPHSSSSSFSSSSSLSSSSSSYQGSYHQQQQHGSQNQGGYFNDQQASYYPPPPQGSSKLRNSLGAQEFVPNSQSFEVAPTSRSKLQTAASAQEFVPQFRR